VLRFKGKCTSCYPFSMEDRKQPGVQQNYIKLLDEVFVISRIIEVELGVIMSLTGLLYNLQL